MGCITSSPLPPPNPDEVDLSHFIICRVLGRGGFGKVQAVQRRSDEQYFAMKSITKSSLLRRTTQSVYMTWLERKVMSSFHITLHPFLLHCTYAFQDPHTLYMVMPLMLGGDLRWYIKHNGPVKESDARFYACEILLALQHMHSLHLVYRDLKPDNVLLDSDGHIRLSDFGLCGRIRSSDGKTSGFCGTNGYIAPEVRDGRRYDGSVDFYAFGVVLYELLTRYTPSRAVDERQRLAMEDLMMGHNHSPASTAHTKQHHTTAAAAAGAAGVDELKQPATAAIDTANHTASSDQYDELFDPRLTYKRRGLSAACQDLLAGLLEYDPTRRLGSGSVDKWDEVRRHEWFSGVDWDVAGAKQLNPPFIPNVNIANCDPVFELEEQIMNDKKKNRTALAPADQQLFIGWEYNTRTTLTTGGATDATAAAAAAVPLAGDELVIPVPAPVELQLSPEGGGGGDGEGGGFAWDDVVMEDGVEVEMVNVGADGQHQHGGGAVDGMGYAENGSFATQVGEMGLSPHDHLDQPLGHDVDVPRDHLYSLHHQHQHPHQQRYAGRPDGEDEPPLYITQ